VDILIKSGLFIILLIVIYFGYNLLFSKLKKKVSNTVNKFDDYVAGLFRWPVLMFLYWILLRLFTRFFLQKFSLLTDLDHFNTLLLIFSITWIIIQTISAGEYYLQNRLNIAKADNLVARKRLTQLKVFKNIANTVIIIVAFSVGLLTFSKARNIGLGLLTSAGVVGIVVGLAAQKSLGMIIAGIQIALTEPIRFDDVVIVEGEWGRIEEITLTYVVVKIWDERRLILPVNYFLEKPFQNWTRVSAEIIGSLFLYTGYDFPVEELRKKLPGMLEGNPDWDGRVMNVQVTNTTERNKEIRILLSSRDSSANWNLRTEIREKLIDFINTNYPDTFTKIRISEL
jgi:small-conductance mechanosensitive channel